MLNIELEVVYYHNHVSVSVFIGAADFEAKYLELEKLGEGSYGTVYAGCRRSDDLPVSTHYDVIK